MIGEGYLLIQDYAVLMLGEGTFDVLDIEPLEMIGEGEMYVGSTANYINAELPSMDCIFRETNNNTGDIYATLPEMSADLVGGLYVPPAIQYIYAILPPLTSSIFVETSSAISIDATLPECICKVADHEYGEIDTTLPEMVGFMQEDPTPDTAQIVSIVYALDGMMGLVEYLVIIDANGQITTTLTGTKEYIAEVISTLSASTSFAGLGTFSMSIGSTVNAQTTTIATIGDGPATDDTGRVCVVNLDNGASSQYDNYGFNDFFERDGEYYGIADDGIYKLDGDDDAGVDIDALLDFGTSNYGTLKKKKSMGVYVGVSSEGKLYLKVTTEEEERVYEMMSYSDEMMTHKIPITHRHKGTHWNLVLTNVNGEDFDVAGINFELFPMTRRIL